MLNECDYTMLYYDYGESQWKYFICRKQTCIDSCCCKFHNPRYAEDHPEEVVELLMNEIDEAIQKKRPLFCIGYNLPDFTMPSDIPMPAPVYFTDAKLRNSNFTGVKFNKEADFWGTEFVGVVNFTGVTFTEDASFSGAAFFRDAIFSRCTFNKIALFTRAIFDGEVSFWGTTFKGEVLFPQAIIKKKADFHGATFKEKADFKMTEFYDETHFTEVAFEKQEEVEFNGGSSPQNLSKVSFLDTDITRLRFGERIIWGENPNDFRIGDELIVEKIATCTSQEHENIHLSSVITVYRNLRENYEYRLRYEEAGRFFIREMELKRIYCEVPTHDGTRVAIKKRNLIRRNLLSAAAIYKLVSEYGESYLRPLTITFIGFVIGTIYFASNEFTSSNPLVDGNSTTITLLNAMSRTIKTFFPFFSLHEQAGVVDLLLRLSLLPIAGAIFITLRRRLERRFRH
jgi:uncharacterized protein YjbI with pentapeptide repeats